MTRARIATLYRAEPYARMPMWNMAWIRWLRISEALARRGFEVDVIVNTDAGELRRGPNLRLLPSARFRPEEYDVIKTLFHRGYDALAAAGGEGHPFIISKLGSVVGRSDAPEAGVHFVGAEREALYATQQRIAEKSRYVTVLTEPSRRLWEAEFGTGKPLLLVPTGVDAEIPPPRRNPYRDFDERIALYAGYLYDEMQKDVNLRWQARLNELGRELARREIRLCVIGPGDVEMLDPSAVTYLGAVSDDAAWDYQHFADVGIVLAQGSAQHNESSKIYYYLRSGLPVVSEDPVPNSALIEETGLGFVVPYDDAPNMAGAVQEAVHASWNRDAAIAHMVERHTWDQRVAIYEEIIAEELRLR